MKQGSELAKVSIKAVEDTIGRRAEDEYLTPLHGNSSTIGRLFLTSLPSHTQEPKLTYSSLLSSSFRSQAQTQARIKDF
jgi:hypothetical protein